MVWCRSPACLTCALAFHSARQSRWVHGGCRQPRYERNASPQAIGLSRANLAGARLLGGQSEAGLGIFAGTQPYHRAWSGIHPVMLRTYARAFVLSVIPGNRRRSPDSSRQLTLSAEDGADRGGVGLGDDEHPKSMVTCRLSDKRGVAPGQGSVTTITSAAGKTALSEVMAQQVARVRFICSADDDI